MQDMSTGNQPDGFAYEYYSSFEMGEFYFKKIIPSPLVVEEPGLSRWPWTLEHAGSNPAIQTECCFCTSLLFIRKEVHYGKERLRYKKEVPFHL